MKHLVETKGKSIYFSLMLTIPWKQPEQTCDFEISSAGHLPVNTNPSHKLFDLSQQKSVSSLTGTKGGGGKHQILQILYFYLLALKCLPKNSLF